MRKPIVLAVAAHPDDVELMMSGTLALLGAAGAEIHIWTLANGCCGTNRLSREAISRIRLQESREAAALIGAVHHEPLFDDLAIFYDQPSLARVSAGLRAIRPDIVLTQSPNEYMEDHCNTCRLTVSAAFTRGIPNHVTVPPVPPYQAPVTVYHSIPYGLTDPLRRPVIPDYYVDVTTVMDTKWNMLACHRSQKEWLDVSQGMDSYLSEMKETCRRVGVRSGKFAFAEGWFRHSHLGFCGPEDDPLNNLLKENGYAASNQ